MGSISVVHILEATRVVHDLRIRDVRALGATLGNQHGPVRIHTLDNSNMTIGRVRIPVGHALSGRKHHGRANVGRVIDQVSQRARLARPLSTITKV